MNTPLRLLRASEVVHRIGVGRTMLFQLVAKREFPQPIRITSRNVGFVESEVDGWINARIAASRDE